MLQIDRLIKRYGGYTAVNGLSINIAPGELFALLGPNGAGKTTTINCLLGFIQPDEGRALIDGLNVSDAPLETKRRLAYIPEQVNLYGHFTGLENLAYFAELSGHRYEEPRLRGFLAEAGLQTEAHARRVSGYSKGMRQKVGIAIALAKEAKVLLLDEPTSGLDPSASHEFSRLLGQLRERGVAILMATHDLFRAKEDATRVGIMRHGSLVRELTAAEISHTDLEKLYLETMSD
ncbi:ABC transporter ATP-binding protein [Cephaloticoccus capnophilus]|uniref:ABC transporter ATP-binding protein n=1 Tax=Cephaloticoccus capnophilus TaxID=1548208 RepID=A0A139SHI1_9BACT|nr:ABC transporter ATP-binding protein [Cephaloticoccus capnophilus]KXU34009.1 ABC transporter ATP-binding protein [Cephaloticoccus capnophilus]